MDELETLNNGIELGMAVGANNPWRKFDHKDQSTWPEQSVRFVGLWEYMDGEYGSEVAFIYRYMDGFKLAAAFGKLQHRTWPQYWCPLPDKMAYEE